MTDHIRDSYDAMSELYTAVNRGDIDRDTPDRAWLAEFAQLAAVVDGPVADLGCGPGYVTNHLSGLGLTTVGYDISSALITEAQLLFPDLAFHVGDFTLTDLPDGSLAGIVARYSLIHSPPRQLANIFGEFSRLLKRGAPVLVSFFAANSAERHGSPFDHAVVTAHELFPTTVASELEDAGFEEVKLGTRRPLGRERPLDHGTILARCANG